MRFLFTTVAGILSRLTHWLLRSAVIAVLALLLQLVDLVYVLINTILTRRAVGKVIHRKYPGHDGKWPLYITPTKDDSRSPCPALNTLANHGILPRNGKHLTYKQISRAIQHAYNLSPTLAIQLTAAAVQLDQGRGWINLHDLNAMNVVQHDASFTRPDIAFCPDQSYPHADLVERFLSHASNEVSLSREDISKYSGLRRAECKRDNGQYSLSGSFLHKFFGSGNSALIYAIFGGDVKDLRIWLAEERFPAGWEPRPRERLGYSITQAQLTSLAIEFNINENEAPGKEIPKDQ